LRDDTKTMAEDELNHVHHYRIEFGLHDKPVEKRMLELMRKIELVKKEVRKQFKDHRGLQNLQCVASYSNYAVCYASTLGEQEWLPEFVEKLAEDPKMRKKEPDIDKIWVRKAFIPPFVPTTAKFKAEENWFNSIQSLKGRTPVLTKEADEKEQEEKEKHATTQTKLD